MATAYCTTLEVFQYLRMVINKPNYPVETTLEEIDSSGTIASGSKIYLDQSKPIDGTYTFYYGASAASVTALVETTDYTIDLDKSQITITAAGAATIGANFVYGEYKYNLLIEDGFISDLITRTQREVNKKIHKTYGGLTLVTREEMPGKGTTNRIYDTRNYPVSVAKTQLTEAVTAISTTFKVDDTTGWEANDVGTIGTEQYTVDTVTDGTNLEVTRGANGTTAAVHSDNDWTVNMVVEVANTPIGFAPTTFRTFEFRKNYDVDSDTGAIQLLHINPEFRDDLSQDTYPPQGVFNRVRITYKHGIATVPDDIKDLSIMLVVKKLMGSRVGKNITEGIQGFDSTQNGIEILDEQINNIIRKNKAAVLRNR